MKFKKPLLIIIGVVLSVAVIFGVQALLPENKKIGDEGVQGKSGVAMVMPMGTVALS